jgi:hypothetical protein
VILEEVHPGAKRPECNLCGLVQVIATQSAKCRHICIRARRSARNDRNVVTAAVTNRRDVMATDDRRALLDDLDRLVHFEGLGNRNNAFGAELVVVQAEIEGGNTLRNVVTAAVTKKKKKKMR